MNDRVVCRARSGVVVALAVASILTLSQSAHAQEVVVTTTAPTTEAKLREPLYLGLDFMLGYGYYTNVGEQLPQPPNFVQQWALTTTQIRTATFTLEAHYRMRNIGFGFRLPLVSGHISGDDALQVTGQDVFNPGNAEFSADMPKKLSDTMKLIPSVALTIPTAPGDATPYSQAVVNNQMAPKSADDQTTLGDAYARYAVNIAAAFARGGEEDALFFNWRLGITPKVKIDMKLAAHSHFDAYAKIPIMIGLEQNSASEEPLRIEAVGAVGFRQELGPVHLGVRLVGMVPIAAARAAQLSGASYGDPMLSVWPEVRLQVTPSAQFWLAGMIPLAGDYNVFNCVGVSGNCVANANGAFNAGISATF